MLQNKKIRLGDLLLEHGLITQEQIEKAFEEQRASGGEKKLGQIIVEKGFVQEEIMLIILSSQLGSEFVPPGVVELDLKIASKIQIGVLKRVEAVPFKENSFDEDGEDSIEVLFSDPLDFEAQDTIQRLLPEKPIKVNITTSAEVKRLLARLEAYENLKETIADIKRELEGGLGTTVEEESAIMRLIHIIITSAVRKKASDIHIEPSVAECRVRARIDGFLEEIYSLPSDVFPPLASRIKLLGNLDIAERRKPQDGSFSLEIDDKEYDFRLSTLPISEGESIVFRILDKTKVLIKLDNIGFSKKNTRKFKQALQTPYGIVFVTGPTGSGKTTTLYAGLHEIKNVSKKIITVEDPVEYQIPLIQQVQVNKKAELTFASALRSILRQDPDIIMIGESRDLETLSIAIQAALTGHLVFTTLHTNDAISAVTRIVDMGIEPFLVSSSTVAIQAQRLIRTVCPYCKEKYEPNQTLLEQIKGYIDDDQQANFVKGSGCKKCNLTGYIGRTIISEVLLFNDKLSSAITSGAQKKELLDIAVQTGFETMFADGIKKAAQGLTTIEEVMRVTTA